MEQISTDASGGTGEPRHAAREPISEAEGRAVAEVLSSEYAVLTAALSATWSASLMRTSLFLVTLSASGVALGFTAQSGIDEGPFRAMALLVLPLVLFLGVATFIRIVQVQRESIVYLTGMNRIRHFFVERAPASRPYLVLPIYDDDVSLYRNIGTGMTRRPPKRPLLFLIVQTQGIVGVVTAAVAAGLGALAVIPLGPAAAWIIAPVSFVATLTALLTYWGRALAELRRAINPLHPTPTDQVGASF